MQFDHWREEPAKPQRQPTTSPTGTVRPASGSRRTDCRQALRRQIRAAEATGSFVFANRQIDGITALELTQYLRDDCRAKFVDLSSLGRWSNCAIAAAAAVQHGLRTVRVLTLDHNDIGSRPEVMEAWCKAICSHPGLQRLSLKDAGLDEASVGQLAQALYGHAVLFSVDVGLNHIYDQGIMALADAVDENHVILEVGVEGTSSTQVARHRLSTVLERNRQRYPGKGGVTQMLRGLQRARAAAQSVAVSQAAPTLPLQMECQDPSDVIDRLLGTQTDAGAKEQPITALQDPSEIVDSLLGTNLDIFAPAHAAGCNGAGGSSPTETGITAQEDAARRVLFDADAGPMEELNARCEAGWRYSAAEQEILNQMRAQILDLKAERRLEKLRAEEILEGIGESQKHQRQRLAPTEQVIYQLKEDLATKVEETKKVLQDRVGKTLALQKAKQEVEGSQRDLSRYREGAQHLDHILKLRHREVAEESEMLERQIRMVEQEAEGLEADNERCRRLLHAQRFETDRERFVPHSITVATSAFADVSS